MLWDNKAMYDLIQQEGASILTRYYERATLLIKRAVLMLILRPFLIGTHYMLGDMFTKAQDKSTFVRQRNVMMNVQGGLREMMQSALCSAHGESRRLMDRLIRRM